MKVNQKVSYNNRTYTIISIEEYDGSLNISQSGYDIQNCKASDAIALEEFRDLKQPAVIDIPKATSPQIELNDEEEYEDDDEEEIDPEPKPKRRKKKPPENP